MTTKLTESVLVLGMGASGLAAARLLRRQGRPVTVADEREDGADVLVRAGFQPEEATAISDLPPELNGRFEWAVVSPGFAAGHRWLKRLQNAGIPVVPEFEFGVNALPGARIIAITGSNGKSSLVKWLADTFQAAGIHAVAAGNYGIPPCALAADEVAPDIVVLELSSFQLEQAVDFKPDVAVLLNLSPNHLDRHGSFDVYARAKARLFGRMGAGDTVIVHAPAWDLVRGWAPPGLQPILFDQDVGPRYGCRDGLLLRHGDAAADVSGSWWGRPPFNINAAAALAVFDRFEIPASVVEASARAFIPLPHRFEEAGSFRGVRFINDSKASTMTALLAAIAIGPEKKHLIAGGILKEPDVNFVKENLAKHCRFVYCIGIAAQKLVKTWQDAVACENCGDLSAAVKQAMKRAVPGEVILLSPGCSSFDQFSSYAQRGDDFKERVRECIREMNESVESTMQGVRS